MIDIKVMCRQGVNCFLWSNNKQNKPTDKPKEEDKRIIYIALILWRVQNFRNICIDLSCWGQINILEFRLFPDR